MRMLTCAELRREAAKMLVKLILVFSKIGFLGFGGGMAIVALIFDSIQEFGTISQTQFADIVAIAQVTPGPVAINTATFVGFKSAGLAGAAAATFGVALPAFIMTAITARMMKQFSESPLVKGGLAGIRPATVGMIATALVTLAKPAIFAEQHLGAGLVEALQGLPVDPVSIVICVVTIVLIGKYKKNPFVVLIFMGCIGAVIGVY